MSVVAVVAEAKIPSSVLIFLSLLLSLDFPRDLFLNRGLRLAILLAVILCYTGDFWMWW